MSTEIETVSELEGGAVEMPILTLLRSQALRDALKATADQAEDLSEEQREELFFKVDQRRKAFEDSVLNVDEEDDLHYMFAVMYIELKSSWILMNNQINYGMVKSGECDMVTMYSAALTSQLLYELEPMLRQTDVSKITDFLAEPMEQVNPKQ